MLLAILQRYISRQEEEKLKIIIDKHGREKEVTETSVKIIFPRYHQLDVVEKLVADTYYANLVKKRGDDKEVNYGMAADEIPLYASRKKPHGNNFRFNIRPVQASPIPLHGSLIVWPDCRMRT